MPVALLALGKRTQQTGPGQAWVYNLGQIALALLLLAAAGTLVAAVQQGLLHHPDTHVMGNGSNNGYLVWYQDRMGGGVARPSIFSLPLYAYRAAMLAWALWLALACVRWSRWIWNSLGKHGLWHPLWPKVVKPSK